MLEAYCLGVLHTYRNLNTVVFANSISIFLRSLREVRPSHDLAICRAMSRAPS
jgi:hypothetical protein